MNLIIFHQQIEVKIPDAYLNQHHAMTWFDFWTCFGNNGIRVQPKSQPDSHPMGKIIPDFQVIWLEIFPKPPTETANPGETVEIYVCFQK